MTIDPKALSGGCNFEGEKYEGMLVSIDDIVVTGDQNDKGQFFVSDSLGNEIIVDRYLYEGNWPNLKNELKNYDIIINATSLGLKNGQDFNFNFDQVKNSLIYIDTIYNPLETKTLKYLKENNIIMALGPAGTGKTYLSVAFA